MNASQSNSQKLLLQVRKDIEDVKNNKLEYLPPIKKYEEQFGLANMTIRCYLRDFLTPEEKELRKKLLKKKNTSQSNSQKLLLQVRKDIEDVKNNKLEYLPPIKKYEEQFGLANMTIKCYLRDYLTPEEKELRKQLLKKRKNLSNTSKKNLIIQKMKTDIEDYKQGKINKIPTQVEYAKLFETNRHYIKECKSELPIEHIDYINIVKEKQKGRMRPSDSYYSNKLTLQTNSGIEVQSLGEKRIADYLYSQKIGFEYDKQISIEHITKNIMGHTTSWVRPDFWLTEFAIIIEYWGMKGEPDYDQKMEWKKKIYEESKTRYISIDPKDLPKLEEILKVKLKRFGVEINE